MSKSSYTSIGVLQETKNQLDSKILKLQAKKGKRLTYDEVIKILIKKETM